MENNVRQQLRRRLFLCNAAHKHVPEAVIRKPRHIFLRLSRTLAVVDVFLHIIVFVEFDVPRIKLSVD